MVTTAQEDGITSMNASSETRYFDRSTLVIQWGDPNNDDSGGRPSSTVRGSIRFDPHRTSAWNTRSSRRHSEASRLNDQD